MKVNYILMFNDVNMVSVIIYRPHVLLNIIYYIM